jgi:branched-chain amino acid transport system permease protein
MLRRRYRGDNMKLFNRKNLIGAAVVLSLYLLVQLLAMAGIVDSYIMINLVIIGINIILAVGLNLITGFTGQFSLGHAAFMSIGAYASAVATAKLDLPFVLSILLAGLAAGLSGILIGIPTLRLKGDYLAIATLGFGEIVRIVILNTEYLGGATGIMDIPPYTNWTWVFWVVVLTIIFIRNLINSKAGRACIAIREDEIAAESTGVNITYYKVMAFAVGAVFAGIAGALYANYFYFIKPDVFGFMRSIDILVIVVFGGMGSLTGSVVGAIALSLISLFLQKFPDLRMVIYSVILFVIMVYRPKGLMGDKEFKLSFGRRGSANVGTAGKQSV